MKIILFGPPGTGKGTQAERLEKEHGLKQVSTGNLFRKEYENKTKLGIEAYSYWGEGRLVPDELTIKILKENLPKDNYILDGFPRTIKQAKELDKITKIDLIINIDSSLKKIIERLSIRRMCIKCKATYGTGKMPKKEGYCDVDGMKLIQRDDDKEEVVKKRFEVYDKETKPVLEYYENKVITINGDKKAEEIYKEVEKIIWK